MSPRPATVPAHRLSGAGNDFLALVEPERDPAPETVRAWCRRGLSLGADGLFVLRRRPADPGDGGLPRVTMIHHNPDGERAELCINGTRCAARLAFVLGWARERLVIETGVGPVHARDAGGDRVELSLPAPQPPREHTVEVDGEHHVGLSVTVGVPHFVLPRAGSLAHAPVAELGAALRRHPAFGAAGTNVDFVRFASPERLEIRSYERGVEAETLACGTGVLAAAAAGLELGRAELPVTALTSGGFELTVDGAEGRGDGDTWTLTGDARHLAELEIHPAALRLPAPPDWGP